MVVRHKNPTDFIYIVLNERQKKKLKMFAFLSVHLNRYLTTNFINVRIRIHNELIRLVFELTIAIAYILKKRTTKICVPEIRVKIYLKWQKWCLKSSTLGCVSCTAFSKKNQPNWDLFIYVLSASLTSLPFFTWSCSIPLSGLPL